MYLTNQNKNNYYLIDIETNGLSPTLIWLICIKNWGTGEKWEFRNDGTNSIYSQFKQFMEEHKEAILVGHNTISFDMFHLSNFCSVPYCIDRLVDTLCLSYLYSPHMDGGHSLEAYGQRLKLPKIANEDWSQLTDNMIERCWQDIEITQRVYEALIRKMTAIGYSEKSCEIEHRIREIIDRQQRHGFYFNIAGARDLYRQLRQRQSDLADQVHKLFPPKLEEVGRYTLRTKKDGSYYASFQKHCEIYAHIKRFNKDGIEVDPIDPSATEYGCYNWIEFNIASPKQRLERLLSLGYVPTAKTKKGNPRIDEDSLLEYAELSRRPEIMAMADWLVCFGRANMIETWLANVGPDSRIHGKVFSCGASTRRMRHIEPNSSNIPSVKKAKYGKECRALWGVEPDKDLVLVGYDADGLETAGLCHYLNNPKATAVLVQDKTDDPETSPDIHSANMRALTKALQRPIDREWGSKTSWYAWLYGAFPKKLGEIVKGPPSDGETVIETFYKNVPGLKQLITKIHRELKQNKGRLKTIDGGSIICSSLSAALNYKIQSMGGIVMKMTAIILDQHIKEEGIDCHKVSDIHDEAEFEVHEKDAKRLGELACQSITEAGEQLGCRVKLTGKYKIGKNWSEVH